MKPIDLYDHEAVALTSGRLGVIIRPVEPQPWECGFGRNPEVHPYCTGTKWPLAYYQRRGACWNSSDPLKSPFGPPGTVIGCREEWGDSWHHAQPKCFYKATDFDKVDWHPDFDGWEPASKMPPAFIRHRVIVGEVRCVRVHDLTEEDAKAAGFPDVSTAPGCEGTWVSAQEGLSEWWDRVYSEGNWNTNPWVWVATIKPE